MAVDKTGWNKPAGELTEVEDAALQAHCDQHTSPRPEPQSAVQKKKEPSSRMFLVLSTIAPFAFLALVVLIFVLLGARPN